MQRYGFRHDGAKTSDLRLYDVEIINKQRCVPCFVDQRRSATSTDQQHALFTFKRRRYGSHRFHGVKARANWTRSILPLGFRGKSSTTRIYLGCMKLGSSVSKYSFSICSAALLSRSPFRLTNRHMPAPRRSWELPSAPASDLHEQ